MPSPYNIDETINAGDPGQVQWGRDVGAAVNDLDRRSTAPGAATFPLIPEHLGRDMNFLAGWVCMVPLWLPYNVTIDRVRITGSGDGGDNGDDATATLKAGIYTASGDVGSAGTLLHDFGTKSLATLDSGGFNWDGGPWYLPAGLYYLGFLLNGATGTPRFNASTQGNTWLGFAYMSGIPGQQPTSTRIWIVDPGGANLPSSTGTLNSYGGGDASYFPAVWIRTT